MMIYFHPLLASYQTMSDEIENAIKEVEEMEGWPEGTRFEIVLTQGVEIRKLHATDRGYSKTIFKAPIGEVSFPSLDANGKELIVAAIGQPAELLGRFSRAQAKKPTTAKA
jgi:hypothetical protein